MDPQEVLNKLLAHACPAEVRKAQHTFIIDLHCAQAEIAAYKSGENWRVLRVEIL